MVGLPELIEKLPPAPDNFLILAYFLSVCEGYPQG
jgi:hypothetical protein